MIEIGGELEPALHFRADTVLSHELLYPLFAHAEPACLELAPHSGPTMLVFDLGVDDAGVA